MSGQRAARKMGMALGLAAGIILLFLVGLVVYFNLIRVLDIRQQARHVESLSDLYTADYRPVVEQQFVSFDLEDNDLRLNEIQLLATHNSYKKLGSSLAKLIIRLVENPAEADALKYAWSDLTTQLNNGVRSFELDLRCRKGDIEVIHVPLVDNSSTAPKFDLALEEIRLWSEHNPGHIPIMVLLELKNDWMMLDPALRDFTAMELAALDELIKKKYGEKLFSPGEIIGEHESLSRAVEEDGWPLLNDLRGRVLFILHPGVHTETYVNLNPDFTAMAMFPAATEAGPAYASFILHNDPSDLASINELVSRNYIVRTRLDSELQVSTQRFDNGMFSGAQLLTTDFAPGHRVPGTDYIAFLQGEYLVIPNTYLVPGTSTLGTSTLSTLFNGAGMAQWPGGGYYY